MAPSPRASLTPVRFLKEAGAEAVKVEGPRVELVRALVAAEVPVEGYIGLTPQSVHESAAIACRPEATTDFCTSGPMLSRLSHTSPTSFLKAFLAKPQRAITAALPIPTIGIGAGPDCDGQILVFHDLVNLTFAPPAKFVRRYGDASASEGKA